MDASWEDEINREEWVEREEEDRGARVGRECEREEIRTLTEGGGGRGRQGWTDSAVQWRKRAISEVEAARCCSRCQAVMWSLFRMFRHLAMSPLGAEQRGRGHTAAALTFY